MSWPAEATANTRNASWPSVVAEMAIPCSRSSNTLGRAKVVDWKTMLETAVVKKTMADTRNSSALMSAGTSFATAGPLLRTLGVLISCHLSAA